ncbi:MAG: 6,7-dimethyl-8-ribityllumazine synthase [Deltaproteobacteria bacterium]
MATVNLSDHVSHEVPDAKGMKFGIVYAEWNPEVTIALKNGAINTLIKFGAFLDDIFVAEVPGTFELTLGGQLMAEGADVDAVILLGCVIQGETRHFDFICQGVTKGATDLNMKYNRPVIFGVLTTENQQQALDRAGGKLGNKGDEAAVTAIKMVAMQDRFEADYTEEEEED